jgi:PD-(D/E)XK nuclease superfamily
LLEAFEFAHRSAFKIALSRRIRRNSLLISLLVGKFEWRDRFDSDCVRRQIILFLLWYFNFPVFNPRINPGTSAQKAELQGIFHSGVFSSPKNSPTWGKVTCHHHLTLIWKVSRDEVLASASRPSMLAQTVTKISRTEEDDRGVQIELVANVDHERPGGRRFGILVHALLAAVELNATPEAIRAAAAIHGRLVDATDAEMNAATNAVVATLKHPLMARAAVQAGNGRLRRETPVLLRRADGTLIEGIVDLAFREDTQEFNGWTVVDFKNRSRA